MRIKRLVDSDRTAMLSDECPLRRDFTMGSAQLPRNIAVRAIKFEVARRVSDRQGDMIAAPDSHSY